MQSTAKRSRWVYVLPIAHLCACLISMSGHVVPQLQFLGIVWVFIVLVDFPVSAITYAIAWKHGIVAGIWVVVVGTLWWYFLSRIVEIWVAKLRTRTSRVPTVKKS